MKKTLVAEIEAERAKQDKKWGPAHDDSHVQSDWIEIIRMHNESYFDGGHYRRHLIKIAALAIAAIESHDRKRRR
jgi:hypothetical protein